MAQVTHTDGAVWDNFLNHPDIVKALIASAHDAIILIDEKGNIYFWNPAAERIFGYKSSEVIGKNLHRLLAPPEYHAAHTLAFSEFSKSGRSDFMDKITELVAIRKGGEKFPIELSLSSFQKDGDWHAAGIVRDISHRQQLERELLIKNHQLNERVKELNCLYSISSLVEKVDLSTDDLLQGIVNLIPPAWQYPEITCARLTLPDREYRCRNYRSPVSTMSADILRHGSVIGSLDISYVDEAPVHDEGPFLKEERGLINTIAQRVGLIIERNSVQKALLESEEKYRLLADNTHDVIWRTDLDLNFTYVNSSIERMIGYTPQEWIGSKLSDHCDEENFMKMAHVVLSEMQKGVAGTGATVEAVILNKDNQPVPVEIVGKVLFDDSGNPVCLQGVGRDITERKQIETEANKVFSEMAALLTGMISGFCVMESIFDDQGVFVNYRVVYINDAYEKLTGLGAKDVLGKTVFEIWPGTEQSWIEKCGSVAVTGNPENFEMYHDPTKKYWRCSLYRPSGSTDRFVMLFDDITELTIARLKETELARKALIAEKLDSLNIMAGSIAHNFNNQLSAVIGYLEMALDFSSLDRETRSYLMKAMTASERSAQLAEQMLLYSGSTLYIPASLDLREVLERDRNQLETTVSGPVTLDIDISKKLPIIDGNPDHIIRLVRNILVNASESIGDTEGQIRLCTGVTVCDEAELRHSYVDDRPSPGRFVFIEVSDTGCGMDPDTLRKLGDPFFTTKFVGRGLGMSEVTGIVKGHRGALFVESQIGKGTTIRVLFPVSSSHLKRAS